MELFRVNELYAQVLTYLTEEDLKAWYSAKVVPRLITKLVLLKHLNYLVRAAKVSFVPMPFNQLLFFRALSAAFEHDHIDYSFDYPSELLRGISSANYLSFIQVLGYYLPRIPREQVIEDNLVALYFLREGIPAEAYEHLLVFLDREKHKDSPLMVEANVYHPTLSRFKPKILSLSSEALSSFERTVTLQCYHNLSELRLSNCGLTEVPAWIQELPSLYTLDLSHNLLREFPSEFNLPKLQELCLAHNQFASFPLSPWCYLKLTSLDLDHNPLNPALTANLEVFSVEQRKIAKVAYLSLNYCELTELPTILLRKDLTLLATCVEFRAAHNYLTSFPFVDCKYKEVSWKLGHNLITQFEFPERPVCNEFLNLDLQYNQITHFSIPAQHRICILMFSLANNPLVSFNDKGLLPNLEYAETKIDLRGTNVKYDSNWLFKVVLDHDG